MERSASRGLRLQNRWPSAVSSKTIARSTVTRTYSSPTSRSCTPTSKEWDASADSRADSSLKALF